MQRGHKSDYKKQIREELLDDAVSRGNSKIGQQSSVCSNDAGKNQYES